MSVAGIFLLKCGVNPVRVVTSVQKVISVAVWSCGESTELANYVIQGHGFRVRRVSLLPT